MSDIEIKKWENKLLETKINLWSIRVGKEFYFFAKEVASSIGYANPREAVRELVLDDKDKTTIEKVLGENYRLVLERIKSTGSKNLPDDFIQKLRTHQKLLTEYGLYSFCIKSRKDRAIPFHNWIHKTIRTIRETGFYVLPGGPVENPLDLIVKVSSFQKEIQNLREEIQTLKSRRKVETCDKETQTQKIISPKKFRSKLEKSIKKLERVEFELKNSLKEISPSSSDSSSSRRSSSSDN